MNAQRPPRRWAWAMMWYSSVVFPELSGPKISTMRPRGIPPMPRAMSSARAPVGTIATSAGGESPIRMMAPLPNCRSICATAEPSASCFSTRASLRAG